MWHTCFMFVRLWRSTREYTLTVLCISMCWRVKTVQHYYWGLHGYVWYWLLFEARSAANYAYHRLHGIGVYPYYTILGWQSFMHMIHWWNQYMLDFLSSCVGCSGTEHPLGQQLTWTGKHISNCSSRLLSCGKILHQCPLRDGMYYTHDLQWLGINMLCTPLEERIDSSLHCGYDWKQWQSRWT